jgi:hypothetical protein
MEHYNVTHESESECWCVGLENELAPIDCFSEKEQAIKFGHGLAQDSVFGRLTVETENGETEIAWAFGSDPVG